MESFIVIEMQTTDAGVTSVLATAYSNRNSAESAYHMILASAALSSLAVHGAAIITNEGLFMDARSYKHEPEPVVETEPEE